MFYKAEIVNYILVAAIVSSLVLLFGQYEISTQLLNKNKNFVAYFLIEASEVAEKESGIHHAPSGSYYGRCMMGKETKKLCDQIYKEMAKHAKTFNEFIFKVNADALTNREMFEKVKTTYLKMLYQRNPVLI